MHVTFQLPYIYNYITKSCRQQAKVVQNYENDPYMGQGEAQQGKYRRLKLGGSHVYDCSSVKTAVVT
jgi:predicted nucleic acid-binding Zn ribbon protein